MGGSKDSLCILNCPHATASGSGHLVAMSTRLLRIFVGTAGAALLGSSSIGKVIFADDAHGEEKGTFDRVNFESVRHGLKSRQNLLIKDVRSVEKNPDCHLCTSPCGYHYRQYVIAEAAQEKQPVDGGDEIVQWMFWQSVLCQSHVVRKQKFLAEKAQLSEQDLEAIDQMSADETLPPYVKPEDVEFLLVEAAKHRNKDTF
eukprot:TRINITY_DN16197_c0_g2_i1.p1 TRINITY_DN16197_c0_g2~~TRINITY_DN16197_c0_g2_i1.p1  ORF type:complete len:201 (-),score=49.65 TRINITY_DN16197_c0_g2_i1:19-621(-)